MSLMHVTENDPDGFIKVVHKRKRKRQKLPIPSYFSSAESSILDPTSFHKKIFDIQNELKCSEFFKNFMESLWSVFENCNSYIKKKNQGKYSVTLTKLLEGISLEPFNKCIDIVCYGLGNFMSCVNARYQLGFLLNLKDNLSTVDVIIYDPLFNDKEKCILKVLGFNVLDYNEEGKRTIIKFTIFFMPHCDKALYNSVLFANWNIQKLSQIIIIGNSFKNYAISTTAMKLEQDVKYLYNAVHMVTEKGVMNIFKFPDIFNDLAIHYFTLEDLLLVLPEKWEDLEEPLYTNDDLIKRE